MKSGILAKMKEKMGRGGEDADSKIPEDAIVVAHTGSEESEIEVHRNASHRDALKRHIDEANPMRSPRNASKQSGHGVHGAPPVSHFLQGSGKAAGAASLLKTLMRTIVGWGVCTTVLLIVIANHYVFTSIDNVRDAYVTHGSAARIKADVLQAFASIFSARDAVHYAIRTKLYYEPLDYATVERILAPIFAATPSIYTVDVAFSDRPHSIVMRRLGDSDVLIQSDAEDCHLISVMGCAVSNETAHEAAWYQVGVDFARKKFRNMATGSSPSTLYKWVGPEFISLIGTSVEGATHTISWAPSYSLIFFTVFPGTMDKLYAVGKVTMDLGKMGRDVLSDPHLGEGGAVYICNKMGRIVAAARPADQVVISPTSGTVHFREIWKLKESWAKLLSHSVFRKDSEVRFEMADGTLVVVSPFEDKRMKDFVVVIVTGRGAFTDPVLWILCILSFVCACLPYLIISGISALFLLRRREVTRRYQRRMLAVQEAKRALTEVGRAVDDFNA